jgi:AhpD family alkylhydroperoxidase
MSRPSAGMLEESMTDKLRLPYWEHSPQAVQLLRELDRHLETTGLDPVLIDLVRLRASQINGCTFCIDKHTRDALAAGETEERLQALPHWRTSRMFDEREKAALLWAETLTRLADTHAPDADYAVAMAHFPPGELSNLSFAIAVINAWNRIAVGFRHTSNPTARTTTNA